MALAERLTRLGTETAFAVSLAASEWGSKGNKIYPFHLGDIDLATPQPIVEAMNKAIADGRTGYCPGQGIIPLREALAADINGARGTDYGVDNIAIQPGGKPVITKFLQVIMNPGDEVLYPNPGFPIYESQIEYLGGKGLPYGYIPTETGFAMDLERIESMITPKTRAIIYNDLQNPISAESSDEERQKVAELALKHDLWVLSDEAYFDIRYGGGESKSIASLDGMKDRTCILYTFSKKYAMTGWRLGAGIAPAPMAKWFSQLNTNNESCTTHFVQYAGVAALTDAAQGAKDLLEVLKGRRDAACDMVEHIPGMTVAKPNATFYLFPDVTEAMQMVGAKDLAQFAEGALHNTGVSFCTRMHFGRPLDGEDRQYIRFAYSGISEENIREGLGKLKTWIEG